MFWTNMESLNESHPPPNPLAPDLRVRSERPIRERKTKNIREKTLGKEH